jgi:hypothetical protein
VILRTALAALLVLAACESPQPSTDIVKPVVHFVNVQDGDTLEPGAYVLVAVATDNDAMRNVVFWQDSTMLGWVRPLGTDTFRCGWDNRDDTARAYWLEAEALDRARNDTCQVIRVHVRR